jgi:hypothetical protein
MSIIAPRKPFYAPPIAIMSTLMRNNVAAEWALGGGVSVALGSRGRIVEGQGLRTHFIFGGYMSWNGHGPGTCVLYSAALTAFSVCATAGESAHPTHLPYVLDGTAAHPTHLLPDATASGWLSGPYCGRPQTVREFTRPACRATQVLRVAVRTACCAPRAASSLWRSWFEAVYLSGPTIFL